MQLTLSHHIEDDVAVVAVRGEIDVYTAPKLRERLLEVISEGHNRVVVDLTEVGFLDSTGLGVLVGALKRVRGNSGELTLAGVHERIRKIFDITGLTTVFGVHDSVQDAIAAL